MLKATARLYDKSRKAMADRTGSGATQLRARPNIDQAWASAGWKWAIGRSTVWPNGVRIGWRLLTSPSASCQHLPKNCWRTPTRQMGNCTWQVIIHLGGMTEHEHGTGPGLTLAPGGKVFHIANRNPRAFAFGEPRVTETDHARAGGSDSVLGQPA
jgi:hypothetical protein